MTEIEKEILTYMIAAPASEIQGMVPTTIRECIVSLNIHPEDYSNDVHYVLILAKMRRKWAQAMIAEAMGA